MSLHICISFTHAVHTSVQITTLYCGFGNSAVVLPMLTVPRPSLQKLLNPAQRPFSLLQELSEDEDLPRGTRLRRKAAPSFGTDRRGKKQKKKVARRQTGKGQTGSGSQGPRQLENYAWLQVQCRRLIGLFGTCLPFHKFSKSGESLSVCTPSHTKHGP